MAEDSRVKTERNWVDKKKSLRKKKREDVQNIKWIPALQEKHLKIHECERYGYSHLFSINLEKIFPYIGKSMDTSFPYLSIL